MLSILLIGFWFHYVLYFLSCFSLLQLYRRRLCRLTWRIDYFGWSLTDRIQVLS